MDGWMDECLLVAVALLQRRNDGGCGRAMLPCLVHVNEAASTGIDEPRGDPSTPQLNPRQSLSIRVNPLTHSLPALCTSERPLIGPLLACKPTAGSVRLCPPVSASIRQCPPEPVSIHPYPLVSARSMASFPPTRLPTPDTLHLVPISEDRLSDHVLSLALVPESPSGAYRTVRTAPHRTAPRSGSQLNLRRLVEQSNVVKFDN